MTLKKTKIYMNGEIIPWEAATIHVASTGAKYGANVFEGICCYRGDEQYLFRLREHLERLHESVDLMRLPQQYSDAEFENAIWETLKANGIEGDAHIRLSIIVTGEGLYDVSGPLALVCMATPRGTGTLAERAVDIGISTWRRIDDGSMPPRIKAGPNYHNGRFALMDAKRHGYDEALLLNSRGLVSESTNSCFMMVRRGALVTPPASAGILDSITRDTFLKIAAEELGIPVEVREIDRTETAIAEEAFLCNSFQEVRPIRSIDGITLKQSAPGSITNRLWDAYEDVARGRKPKYRDWLASVGNRSHSPATA
ncbi:MAG: branched-chain-amino-acid transaminase [Mesorhizobium sp.]|uniref:branched-chain-amino-acid transaminase n=1 Tax=Mesorhizobium sp. TaxID=1871066 RepID=UPI000FE6886A|nr:branched-chain-amino-acid transaminase [Mesorhizobium sp.]RWO24822.1 MAG: branched-chain-amino-acid transaminase [Mesorhizobium sp.]